MIALSRFRVLVVAAIAAVAWVLLAPSAALAHDVLVDQTPADGAVLETAPDSLTLSFNNNLIDIGESATVMRVMDAEGNVVIDDVPTLSGMQAIQSAKGLEDGAYRLIWRVVSSDGHPITGVSTFAIGANGAELLKQLPPLGETTATDEKESAGTNQTVSTPMIIAIAVVGVGLIGALIVIVLRKGNTPK